MAQYAVAYYHWNQEEMEQSHALGTMPENPCPWAEGMMGASKRYESGSLGRRCLEK